jgi:hypothetical protein
LNHQQLSTISFVSCVLTRTTLSIAAPEHAALGDFDERNRRSHFVWTTSRLNFYKLADGAINPSRFEPLPNISYARKLCIYCIIKPEAEKNYIGIIQTWSICSSNFKKGSCGGHPSNKRSYVKIGDSLFKRCKCNLYPGLIKMFIKVGRINNTKFIQDRGDCGSNSILKCRNPTAHCGLGRHCDRCHVTEGKMRFRIGQRIRFNSKDVIGIFDFTSRPGIFVGCSHNLAIRP